LTEEKKRGGFGDSKMEHQKELAQQKMEEEDKY